MLRRRHPYRFDNEGTGDAAPLSTAHIIRRTQREPAHSMTREEQPDPVLFDKLSDETLQHIFSFLPDRELPIDVSTRFAVCSRDILGVQPKKLLHEFIKDKFVLKINNMADATHKMKLIRDFCHFCLTDMTDIEKQAAIACLLLMIMQLMEFMTRENIATFYLQQDEMIILAIHPDNTLPEHIHKSTPIVQADVDTLKKEIQQRFGSQFTATGHIEKNIADMTGDERLQSSLPWLTQQSNLLKLSIPYTAPPIFSYFLACAMWTNPLKEKLTQMTAHCIDSIENHLTALNKAHACDTLTPSVRLR